MSFLVSIATAIGSLFSAVGTTGCTFVWVDEPEMPKCLIEK